MAQSPRPEFSVRCLWRSERRFLVERHVTIARPADILYPRMKLVSRCYQTVKFLTKIRVQRKRVMGYSKEMTLLFLAVFYFLIATNTQTGWLFVLSAFLLGLLALSWFLSRRSLDGLRLEQSWLQDPLKNQPFRVSVTLSNQGRRTAQEIRVQSAAPDWGEPGEEFIWAIPSLAPSGTATTERRLVPKKRGEHRLPPLRLLGGAPFGLFTATRTWSSDRPFLVFPEIERLPTRTSRSRLAAALGDVASPRGLGDTRSLRSVRDYRPGDDLRQVHWKATAKRGSSLLVREHHAPAPAKSIVWLDTSAGPKDDALFERAVTLAASLLWSAHREGTQALLLCPDSEGEWEVHRHWPKQYRALALVKRQDELCFDEWVERSERAAREKFARETVGGKACLIRAHEAPVTQWPDWARTVFLLLADEAAQDWPIGPRVFPVDGRSGRGFPERSSHV
jgi:uncharacterized protein (DUF58 family)